MVHVAPVDCHKCFHCGQQIGRVNSQWSDSRFAQTKANGQRAHVHVESFHSTSHIHFGNCIFYHNIAKSSCVLSFWICKVEAGTDAEKLVIHEHLSGKITVSLWRDERKKTVMNTLFFSCTLPSRRIVVTPVRQVISSEKCMFFCLLLINYTHYMYILDFIY